MAPTQVPAFWSGTVNGYRRFIRVTVSEENKGVSPLLAFGLNFRHQKLHPPADPTGGSKGGARFDAVGRAEKQRNWVGRVCTVTETDSRAVRKTGTGEGTWGVRSTRNQPKTLLLNRPRS